MARLTLRGTVRGNPIEIEGEPGLPSGARVTVTIEADPLAIEARRALLEELCGAWAGDTTLPAIFDDLRRRRRRVRPRAVDFDAAS